MTLRVRRWRTDYRAARQTGCRRLFAAECARGVGNELPKEPQTLSFRPDRASRSVRDGRSSLLTRRWREGDSNRRSPVRATTLFETVRRLQQVLPRQRPAPSRQCAEARRRRAGGHFLGRRLTAVPRCSRQRAMASRERSDVVAITGHDECRRASLECPSLASVNGFGTPCCVPRL